VQLGFAACCEDAALPFRNSLNFATGYALIVRFCRALYYNGWQIGTSQALVPREVLQWRNHG
jgi:hypothetical protein